MAGQNPGQLLRARKKARAQAEGAHTSGASPKAPTPSVQSQPSPPVTAPTRGRRAEKRPAAEQPVEIDDEEVAATQARSSAPEFLAGEESILGWDPSKVERTSSLLGKKPPFMISYARANLPTPELIQDLPGYVQTAMETPAMAYTRKLHEQVSKMTLPDILTSAAILGAQAGVITHYAQQRAYEDREAHQKVRAKLKEAEGSVRNLTEGQKTLLEAAEDANKKVEELEAELGKCRAAAAELSREQLARRQVERELAETKEALAVAGRDAVEAYKDSDDYAADMNVAYNMAFRGIIKKIQEEHPEVDATFLVAAFEEHRRLCPLPPSHEGMDELEEPEADRTEPEAGPAEQVQDEAPAA